MFEPEDLTEIYTVLAFDHNQGGGAVYRSESFIGWWKCWKYFRNVQWTLVEKWLDYDYLSPLQRSEFQNVSNVVRRLLITPR